LDKGIGSFEDETVDTSLDTIITSDTAKGFVSTVVPRAKPEQWMRKQELIAAGKPRVAAVLSLRMSHKPLYRSDLPLSFIDIRPRRWKAAETS
jgi:hypothetical protein